MRVMIDDGKIGTRTILAAALALGAGLGFGAPPTAMPRREDYAPKFTWAEDRQGRPWRTPRQLSKRKRKRVQRADRKRRRGY